MILDLTKERSMDVYEIAVNFQDAAHQGDRRKKSQQCHMKSFCKIFEWFSIFIILLPTNTFTCFKWFHVTIRKNPYAQRTWLVSHRDQAWLVSLGIRTRHSPSLGHSLARLHPSPGQGCRIFKTLTLTKPWHLIGGFLGIAKKKFGDAWGTYFHLKTLFRRTKSKYFGWVFLTTNLRFNSAGWKPQSSY